MASRRGAALIARVFRGHLARIEAARLRKEQQAQQRLSFLSCAAVTIQRQYVFVLITLSTTPVAAARDLKQAAKMATSSAPFYCSFRGLLSRKHNFDLYSRQQYLEYLSARVRIPPMYLPLPPVCVCFSSLVALCLLSISLCRRSQFPCLPSPSPPFGLWMHVFSG